jgi:hypothetical protein
MHRPSIALAATLIATSIALAAPPARAQEHDTAAQSAFDAGRQLMTAGKYAEACAAFEKSQKLDPQIGTRYNIGLCLEKQGKLSSAWTAYREVAQRDTNAGRRADAAKRAQALAPRLTKILINSAASPVGFSVHVNDTDATDLLGIDTPVDPGTYTITAAATGCKTWSATVAATGEGQTVTVSIPALEKASATQPAPHSEPGKETTTIAHLEASGGAEDTGPPGQSHRKTLGLAVGAGGAALVIGGAVAGVMARSKWHDAMAVCGGTLSCANDMDVGTAEALASSAKSRANISTALFGVGGVAIAVGAALWLTAPREASHGVAIAPVIGPGDLGFAVAGRF